MTKITPDEFRVFSRYVHGLSGIYLDESKTYLIETRLGRLLEELGCASYSELYYRVKSDAGRSLERKIIDAITTKETQFFRDTSPFDLLRHKIVPELIDRRTAGKLSPVPIRIWSAACSTGQEVYSIAIVLKELLRDLKRYTIRILGTDISDEAVAQASYGQYNKFEIERGLPPDKLHIYFTPKDGMWKIRDEIRAMVTFRKHNLMEPFAGIGKFDIIFCRNVAIYFLLEDRTRLFKKIAEVLEREGYLIIGSTESLSGVCPLFEPKRYLRSVFYQLKA